MGGCETWERNRILNARSGQFYHHYLSRINKSNAGISNWFSVSCVFRNRSRIAKNAFP